MVEEQPVGHEVAGVQDDGRQHVDEERVWGQCGGDLGRERQKFSPKFLLMLRSNTHSLWHRLFFPRTVKFNCFATEVVTVPLIKIISPRHW